jgi:hypothetical protein
MGDVILLFNTSRPQRLIELSNGTQMASRTLAEISLCSGIIDADVAFKRRTIVHADPLLGEVNLNQI